LAGGTQDDGRGAVLLADLVRNRRADDRHADEVLLAFLDALVDRERDFVGLAVAPAHAALPVADHDERVEAEALAALDDLGAALDLDDDLLELVAGPALPTLPHFGHSGSSLLFLGLGLALGLPLRLLTLGL